LVFHGNRTLICVWPAVRIGLLPKTRGAYATPLGKSSSSSEAPLIMRYPNMLRIRQHFERPRVEDVAGTVRAELEKLDLGRTIRPGQSVALTAGSRGIANIQLILKSVVRFLKDLGARPFLVPTMGSHGGGTAEGQRQVLESYGITEAFVGAPIMASMEVVPVGNTSEGFPVVLDRHASEA